MEVLIKTVIIIYVLSLFPPAKVLGPQKNVQNEVSFVYST